MTMSSPRMLPPPLSEMLPDQRTYVCSLDGSVVRRHQWPGTAAAFSCSACQAYWPERAVRDGEPGAWDDSGRQCSASETHRDGDSGRWRELSCILGDDHVVEPDTDSFICHVAPDGTRWLETTEGIPAPAGAA